MHYGDNRQLKVQELIIIVYKHQVLSIPIEYNKKGLLKMNCVYYDVTSIPSCKFFNVNLLLKILKKPYTVLNTFLSDKPFEKYYEICITENKDQSLNIVYLRDATEDKEELKRLH